MQTQLKSRLVSSASALYGKTGFFNYCWARGKLSLDPVFAGLLTQRVFSDRMRILDLGCGRGLLAAWFLMAEALAEQNLLPDLTSPQHLSFTGVELMAREADCGMRALQPRFGQRVSIASGDMRQANLAGHNVITILDVLHYLPFTDQEVLLDRIRAALPPAGVFVTRIGDAKAGWRFAYSQCIDHAMFLIQGHRQWRNWCRPLEHWITSLEARGFSVTAQPMSAGTLFANTLLVARLP